MKISNSKKHLAKIIHENGGWRDGADTCSCDNDGYVNFFVGKPARNGVSWIDNGDCEYVGGIVTPKYEKIKNWHQTILSRDEYFHLYPAPDADGWIEWLSDEMPVEKGTIIDVKYSDGDELHGAPCGVYTNYMESKNGENASAEAFGSGDGSYVHIVAYRLHKPEQSKSTAVGDDETNLAAKEELEALELEPAKPTIEQLAADYRNAKDYAERKQEEADTAKADVEAKLKALELACEALGLIVSPITEKQEPVLEIADWRDLRVGDVIEYVDGRNEDRIGMVGRVDSFDRLNAGTDRHVRIVSDSGQVGWPTKWRFIRRP